MRLLERYTRIRNRMLNPLEQFKIISLVRLNGDMWDISITNSTIMLLISIGIILLITKGANNKRVISSKWNRIIEISYERIEIIVKDTIGKSYSRYTPFIISLFFFI